MISKLLTFSLGLLLFAGVAMSETPQSDALPLSTHSKRTARLMEKVWVLNSDQVEQEKACVVLRKIVRVDPKFAVGHELLAQFSLDPGEQVSEQHKATAMKAFATPPEQTLVDWFQSAADHEIIPAITNMNQLVNQYPHDKWVVMLANFCLQGRSYGYPGNCQFTTYQQCQATASGTLSYCGMNPRFAYGSQPQRRRAYQGW